MAAVERTQLGGDGFTIARLVTGLWQIADMEKDGEEVDLGPAATDMREYAESGLDTFDMADHCDPPTHPFPAVLPRMCTRVHSIVWCLLSRPPCRFFRRRCRRRCRRRRCRRAPPRAVAVAVAAAAAAAATS